MAAKLLRVKTKMKIPEAISIKPTTIPTTTLFLLLSLSEKCLFSQMISVGSEAG